MAESPVRTHLRVDEEGYPADHHEEAGGQVVGDHVEGHLPGEDELEARHGVVHVEGRVLLLLGVQGVDLNLVVEDGPDRLLLHGDELIVEDELVHGVVEAPHLECAHLEHMYHLYNGVSDVDSRAHSSSV